MDNTTGTPLEMRCIRVGLAPFRPPNSDDDDDDQAPTESIRMIAVTVGPDDTVAETLRKVLEDELMSDWGLKLFNRNSRIAALSQQGKSCRVHFCYGDGKDTEITILRAGASTDAAVEDMKDQGEAETIYVGLVCEDEGSITELRPCEPLRQFADMLVIQNSRGRKVFSAQISTNLERFTVGDIAQSMTLRESTDIPGVVHVEHPPSTIAPSAEGASTASVAEAGDADRDEADEAPPTSQKKRAKKNGDKDEDTAGAAGKATPSKPKDGTTSKKGKKIGDKAGTTDKARSSSSSSSSAKSADKPAGAAAAHDEEEIKELTERWYSLSPDTREGLSNFSEKEFQSMKPSLKKAVMIENLSKLSDNHETVDNGDKDASKGKGSEAASKKKGSKKPKARDGAADGKDAVKTKKLTREEEEALEVAPEGYTFPKKVLSKFTDGMGKKEKWQMLLEHKRKNREAAARSIAKKKAREEAPDASGDVSETNAEGEENKSGSPAKKSTKKRKKSDEDEGNEGTATKALKKASGSEKKKKKKKSSKK